MADPEALRRALAALADAHGLAAVADAAASLWNDAGSTAGPVPDGGSATLDFGSETLDPDATTSWAPPASAAPARPAPRIAGRYDDLGLLARGGMGEVRRVRDTTLGRTVALKRVHPELARRPASVARFLEEVRATAQLQHPAIVPVYDLGQTPDGRPWFTMQEVRGQTLLQALRALHGDADGGGWTLARLVQALWTAAQAVAFAHGRGLVHRDLKPENLMLGERGEVFVLDWGLAKGVGFDAGDGDAIATGRMVGAAHATRWGQVAGTPAYLAPEQAEGDLDRIGPATDVYGLGAMLYELLAGRPPYPGDAESALARVRAGPPPAIPVGPLAPAPLVAVCARAMARSPGDRMPSAEAFADALQGWLDGSARQARAAMRIHAAAGERAASAALRAAAEATRAQGEAGLAALPPWAPAAEKAAGWEQLDRSSEDVRRALDAAHRAERELVAALREDPDAVEAHAGLVDILRARHEAAEAAAATAEADRVAGELEVHLAALPGAHPVRRSGEDYLRGTGALTLYTDPPGARVAVLRYHLRGRRWVAEPFADLGETPLVAVPLPMGSYLCVLTTPGGATVRYPVQLTRGAHWDGVPPEGGAPAPLRLPRPGELGPDDVLVPAGWFRSGLEPWVSPTLPARRLWVDGWVIRRHPVTAGEYAAFLNDQIGAGRVDEALRHQPMHRGTAPGTLGEPVWSRGSDGLFGGGTDSAVPVTLVDWYGAQAFAAWEAARTGQPWQLCRDLMWEKAARGVDGRVYPWGDWADSSWFNRAESQAGGPAIAPVTAFPADESPYGVRGMAGNVRDWCEEVFLRGGPEVREGREVEGGGHGAVAAVHLMRGSSWLGDRSAGRATDRYAMAPTFRYEDTGFRLARRWGPAANPR